MTWKSLNKPEAAVCVRVCVVVFFFYRKSNPTGEAEFARRQSETLGVPNIFSLADNYP